MEGLHLSNHPLIHYIYLSFYVSFCLCLYFNLSALLLLPQAVEEGEEEGAADVLACVQER